MGYLRRRRDALSVAMLVAALTLVAVGFARAQSQDATNARVDERILAVDRRVEKIETTLGYGMAALVANLLAHLFQIRTNVRSRARWRDEEDA